MANYEYTKNLQKFDNNSIQLDVKFFTIDHEIPYIASDDDLNDTSKELYQRAVNGNFGEVINSITYDKSLILNNVISKILEKRNELMLNSGCKVGEYPVKLEVNIDGKLYTPLQETLKFESEVQIIAKVKTTPLIKNQISVSKVKVENKIRNIPKEIKVPKEIIEEKIIDKIEDKIVYKLEEVIIEKEIELPKHKSNFSSFKSK